VRSQWQRLSEWALCARLVAGGAKRMPASLAALQMAHAGFTGCIVAGGAGATARRRLRALCAAQLTPRQKQGKPPPVADRAAYAGIDNVQARARDPRLPAALPGRLCMSARAASATCWQWPPRLMPSGMGPAAGRQRQLPDQDRQHNRRVHHHGARPCSPMQPRAPCLCPCLAHAACSGIQAGCQARFFPLPLLNVLST